MKKYLPHILIFVVVIAGAIGPFGIKTAKAGVLGFLNLSFNGIVASIGNFILTLVSKTLAISGYFLEASIKHSITNVGFESMDVIEAGWKVTRDLANLFFIFIILYIAIATILRLSGYGMKELLAKVVILALLVNFSLLITQVIIDSSNVLAMEFYDKISNMKNAKGEKMSLSEVYVNGLNPQSLFKVSTNEEADAMKFTNGQEATLSQIGIITLLGSGMILVTAFVLFAAGVLFVTRLAILWILMVLAPLAFVAMALPATKGYASQWWKKLFDQSFFAPVFLALLYIVVKIIGDGNLLGKLGANNAAFSTAFGAPDESNVTLVLNFVILIALTIACLVVAKQMGAYGASAVMKWGQDARKWGQGYAGRISRRGAGAVAEGVINEKSWINQKTGGRIARVSAVPLVGRGLSYVSALGREERENKKKSYKKEYGTYSDAGLKTMLERSVLERPYITRDKRSAIEDIRKERSDKDKARIENIKREQRKEELRKVADDTGQDTATRLAAMKLLGELDVQTELSETKKQLAAEKEKSASAKPAAPPPPPPKSA